MVNISKILIVDDEPRFCDSLKVLLSNEGYETQTARSGHEAIASLDKNDFDLVLLDIVMPDADGYQVMDYINRQSPDTFVIVVTGQESVDSAVKFLRTGAFDYLRKPFEHEDLLKTVKNALEQKRVRREYKRAEKALRDSEAQKQAILDASVDMIMHIDSKMRIVWANKVAAAVIYKTPEDLIGHTCHKFFQNAASPCTGCPCTKALESGMTEHATLYHPAMNAVGESYWEHYGVPLRDEFDQVVGVIEIARNVTEKLKAEHALIRAKEDWENTFDAITDMVMLLDSEHRIIRVNTATATTLGISKENLVDKKCYEVVHGQSHPIAQCPLARTMKTLEAHTNEIIEPNIGGGTFICSTSPIVDQVGELIGYTHTLKDITESKRLESKLQRAQKMEAIGTLAGGIAHDFNNLLTGILGNTSLMLLEVDASHPNYKRLKRIETQVLNGVKLTKQLLGYARKGRYEVKPLDLNQLVEETSDTFGRTRKEITIHRELAEDLFAVEADSGQIEQVLLNLFVNAADAMPGGGYLILKTMNVTDEDMKGKGDVPTPGDYVLFKVTDTGIGMDKETKQRIFDPFFTTKGIGKGTGLGLASAYGIIKSHGGYMHVKSQKAHGTTFYVYLPASRKKVAENVKNVERITAGTGLILLIDDEPIVLGAGADMLKETGYKVLEAKGGREAVKIYEENKDKIDLVILDMIMPDMGGGEAYNRIKEINPNVKVLLSSGYSIDGQAAKILERGCNGFIQKPFSLKELSGKVKDILDQA